MEITINEQNIKPIIKEILIDMLKNRQKEFIELIEEAIEDIGIANAISEGRKDDLVSERSILKILD